MDPADHTTALIERGYTVFERAYDPEWVAAIRADIDGIHAEHGRPRCHAAGNEALADDVYLCAAGMAVRRLLHVRPRWANDIVKPEVVAALRGALGQDMTLEIAGCVVSDTSRPFFAWHTHVGGVDDGVYRRTGVWPSVSTTQRVMTLTYLQDLGEHNGPMLIYPRKVGDPIAPPHDPDARSWPGQVELRLPAGSLVAVDECTWHAIPPTTEDALRMFIGLTYAARDAPVGGWADDKLSELASQPETSELLRSVLG
ncbi:phytanoyl-CoA dioxygenase family protein [Enhygromyxa salina]|uniref:Phytanoyl-CoA dioxygenase PhyH n=1 Tax=Enhygromyxa salina TaxID=215803 RepID=A0A2S9YIQ6_9BACT|nr:phytanoyl-CoA dioxygenase family protein [Enhygromyxa salina]PRQ04985.1 Phytanoyl-CoA dioxygenase PhyH [Enhygromyxa salina]